MNEAGESGGAAAKFPQEVPGPEGGHGLLAQSSEVRVGPVDVLPTGGKPLPSVAEGHPDGTAGTLIALVRPASQAIAFRA